MEEDILTVKNISLALKDQFDVPLIVSIAQSATHLPKSEITQIVRKSVKSDEYSNLSAYDTSSIIDYLFKLEEPNEHQEPDEELKLALKSYVNQHECNNACMIIISNNIHEKRQMTVYRGHSEDAPTINTNVLWFSTSKSKDIAKKEFSDKNCCIFKIHLDSDVPSLDIKDYITGKYGYEKEVIVKGGGTFYKSIKYDIQGFKEIIPGEYETWYSFRTNNNEFNVERILKIIPEEEYDFITSPADITMDISDNLKVAVFDEINKRKNNQQK